MDTIFAKFAVPAVSILVAFLSYSSQYLFEGLQPGPLTREQKIRFNVLVACIWICYARACLTNPGGVPRDWAPTDAADALLDHSALDAQSRHRYCRKCEAFKPPRSHHCKTCKRCIPKMDHHCPWTINCVSHFTFPHFMRFLFYAVTSMTYLEYFLYQRAESVWQSRNLPSYLGPTPTELVHLFVLVVVNSLTLFLVGVTFLRTIWGLGGNVTTIESWEIERHEQLLRRARVLGGYLDGPDGRRIRINRQEFPYDIGIWSNIVQGMGTANVLAWFWPLAITPRTDGLSYETNGFEDPGTTWPPPDPDRMPRVRRPLNERDAFIHPNTDLSPDEQVIAFKQRQQADMAQRPDHYGVHRRKPFHERFEHDSGAPIEDVFVDDESKTDDGEEGWQDTGGNRLKDFGVLEDIEFYDEDDIPISELLRRRRQAQAP